MVSAPPALDPRARRLLRRRKWRRWTLATAGVALAALLVGARLFGGPAARATDHARFHQQRFAVAEIPEGDTLLLTDADGGTFRVRLLGVDSAGRPAARELARALCGGEVRIYLETVPTRNRAGELLAYVFDAAGSLINQRLIEAGEAFADRRYDFAYARTFGQAEEQAFLRKRGMWEQMTEDQMPEWRRRWLAEMQKAPWHRGEWRRPDEP